MSRNLKRKENLSLEDNIHQNLMRKASRLALRARGQTSPNPLVGALVVKDGKILGRGFHRRAGTPHAEVIALDRIKEKVKGATLYVTLEPCSTYGRTPPCVNRILESGIKEVIIGMIDPNPRNKGKAIKILKENNIDVRVGFLEEELRRMNESYIKYITKKLPFITVKVGQSLDGRIATRKGQSKWITSLKSRGYSKRMRKFYDAIMVGVNTVIKDNPLLKIRESENQKKPVKIIVDSKLRTPLKARIFSKDSKVIIATTKKSSPFRRQEKYQKLKDKGVEILETKEKKGRVDLLDLMRRLARKEITNILVEGGGSLIGSLFDENLVDKVMFFISPKIIGGKDAISSVEGVGTLSLNKAIRLKDVRIKRIREDILVEGICQMKT